MNSQKLTLNLHDYDKKANDIIERIRNLPKPDISEADLAAICKEIGPVADVWDILIKDHGVDIVNNVRVDELICFIANLWMSGHKDPRTMIIEQLTDMRTGLCQPGRTLRLCQLIDSFY
jgi:hypothetical protein